MGFDDVRIDRATVHGNYDTGIETDDGVAYLAKGYAHRNLVISDCDVSDNFGGNGIIVSGVDGGTVEFCRAAGNHGSGGALGMWTWCARNVTFRYCIANGTRGKSDSGGYDLDGGSVNCAMEHCMSYDNDGPGYMHCDYPQAPRTEKNAFRDSVSVNDGRRGGPTGFGFVVWGSGLYDCTIERDLAVLTEAGDSSHDTGLLFASFIRTDSEPLSAQRLEGGVFRDNTVDIATSGAAFVNNNFPAAQHADLTFRGNEYRSSMTAGFVVGPKRFPTTAEWRTSTGDTVASQARTWPPIGDYRALRPRDLPAWFRKLGK